MKNTFLFGLLFSIIFSAYSQDNIVIKIIKSRVILKASEADPYGNDHKYYEYSPFIQSDKNISNTMGGYTLDSLARNAYSLAINGKIKVYAGYGAWVQGSEVNFGPQMSREDILSELTYHETYSYTSSEPPYEQKDSIHFEDFDPTRVAAIDFFESWTINSKTMEIKKKIIAICPMLAVYDPVTGGLRGYVPMFWIKM